MQENFRRREHRPISARPPGHRPALHLLALLLFVSLYPLAANSQQIRPTAWEVKAAYLYNFGKFVRWPGLAQSRASFDICVVGKNPFGSALQSIVSGEKIDGANIVVKNSTSLQDAGHCRIFFVSSSEENRIKPILAAARQSNVLTVSDVPGFAQLGGMIELVNQEENIRFAVNLSGINEAGLTVSSELLKVAVKVVGINQARGTDR